MPRSRVRPFIAVMVSVLSGCGGGGSGGGSGNSNSNGSAWVAGVFQPESTFVAQCANPRSGRDPITGVAFPDKQGSTLTENNWLRSWSNDLYLWFNEIVDRDPSQFSTPDYFKLLKTPATTPSGAAKDRFHFTM